MARSKIGVPLAGGSRRAQLLLFVAPDCPVCKKIIPLAQAFARRERLEVLYVGDGDLGEQRGSWRVSSTSTWSAS